MSHANAPLTRLGRERMVALVVEDSLTLEAAAAASNVSVSTCHRWVVRRREASEEELADGSWAEDRSSRPHRQPTRCSEAVHDEVVAAREAHPGWGPRLLAVVLGMDHTRCLRRRGVSRLAAGRASRFGGLSGRARVTLQMDTKRFARFSRPGHKVTGDRSTSGAEKRERMGYEFAHSIIDDHTRLLTPSCDDERADTVTAFVERALAFYAAHGITPTRLQTDNAWTYTHNNSLRRWLSSTGFGCAESRATAKLSATLAREWAYGQTYRSSDARAQALTHWLEHYNLHRNHSGIGNRPPASRVPNLPQHNS